jgi:hypothetical protein
MIPRIVLILALACIMVAAAAVVFVPAPEPTTKLVHIGPTPLDDQIRYPIEHSK